MRNPLRVKNPGTFVAIVALGSLLLITAGAPQWPWQQWLSHLSSRE